MLKSFSTFAVMALATSLLALGQSRTPPRQSKRAKHLSVRATHTKGEPNSGTLPVTTSSEESRALYEAAIISWENLQTDSALKRWRTAANIDPDFALAHLMLSYSTPDPAEEKAERQRAESLAGKVTPGERLLIRWFDGIRENNYVSGIAAMNDLLQEYPRDKQLFLWAGSWLLHQQEYELAGKRLEEAVAIDPNFASALNDLGYVYALEGDYGRSFTAMQRYVELLPNEPNPQDSYAEILRMAGRYEEAVDHYRMALHIDPNFHSSQMGIADTFSLMGDQRKARQEYFKARVLATDRLTELQDLMQSAFTYVRARDIIGADDAFEEVVQQAHRAGLPVLEAEAWRMRARLQFIVKPEDLLTSEPPDTSRHFPFLRRKTAPMPDAGYLDKAEEAMKSAKAISESDRQDELARILCERAQGAAHQGRFLEANTVVAQLEAMAGRTPSVTVQHAFDGAKGAGLVYEGNYETAIPILERDSDNMFSRLRLVYAAQKAGNAELAKEQLGALREYRQPTPEQSFLNLLPSLDAVPQPLQADRR